MMKRIEWKQALVFLLAGVLLGAALAGAAWRCRWSAYKDPDHRYERILDKFNRKLDLTAEQREKVAAILQAKRTKIEALRGQFGPRFDEIRLSARRDISAILTPDQQAKFDKMTARHDARRKKHHRWK